MPMIEGRFSANVAAISRIRESCAILASSGISRAANCGATARTKSPAASGRNSVSNRGRAIATTPTFAQGSTAGITIGM